MNPSGQVPLLEVAGTDATSQNQTPLPGMSPAALRLPRKRGSRRAEALQESSNSNALEPNIGAAYFWMSSSRGGRPADQRLGTG